MKLMKHWLSRNHDISLRPGATLAAVLAAELNEGALHRQVGSWPLDAVAACSLRHGALEPEAFARTKFKFILWLIVGSVHVLHLRSLAALSWDHWHLNLFLKLADILNGADGHPIPAWHLRDLWHLDLALDLTRPWSRCRACHTGAHRLHHPHGHGHDLWGRGWPGGGCTNRSSTTDPVHRPSVLGACSLILPNTLSLRGNMEPLHCHIKILLVEHSSQFFVQTLTDASLHGAVRSLCSGCHRRA
mmetsp:Transcript_46470/g.86884  ORF Transcript_46470/g.86884 Transcript_46470/m.86884 type:complete len:245 (-) Transcript_46470:182-916(-)